MVINLAQDQKQLIDDKVLPSSSHRDHEWLVVSEEMNNDFVSLLAAVLESHVRWKFISFFRFIVFCLTYSLFFNFILSLLAEDLEIKVGMNNYLI